MNQTGRAQVFLGFRRRRQIVARQPIGNGCLSCGVLPNRMPHDVNKLFAPTEFIGRSPQFRVIEV